MAKKKKDENPQTISNVEQTLTRTEHYLEENYKTLLIGLGVIVNAELVRKGYGMVMTVPPNVRYAEKFLKLQQTARKRNRGLWNESK